MRDKLMDLIVNGENELFRQRNYFTDMERIEHTADYLIAHGVTLVTDNDEKCPGRNWCKTGHKGTVAWLKQPVKEET